MNDLTGMLSRTPGRDTLGQLGGAIDADKDETETAVSAALPLLVGARRAFSLDEVAKLGSSLVGGIFKR